MAAREQEFNAFKQYEPSEPACIIFIVIFAVLLAAHFVQAVRAKVSISFYSDFRVGLIFDRLAFQIWYMWPLILSTGMEVVGYILR
jgi:hypothetical protein